MPYAHRQAAGIMMKSPALKRLPAAGAAVLAIALLFVVAFGAAQEQNGKSGAANRSAPSLIPSGLEREIERVEREVDQIEQQALARWRAMRGNPGSRMKQVQVLGELLLFDKNLSVNRNEACSFCHMPETDFTGPISILNQTAVAYPGSVRHRFGRRKPQSYTYASFYPALQYNRTQQDFYGGNFWDLRATGYRLQNPAAEQAQGPPVDPNEMGFADTACVVHRLSQSAYRPLFEAVWGEQAFAIQWPADIEPTCGRPGPAAESDPYPVHLGKADRGRSNSTYDQFALSVASYEASPDVSPFSSKFDYALANPGKRVLSPEELAGWTLFRGRAKCNTCHLDGTESSAEQGKPSPAKPANAASVAPLFTDFTSNNLGLPRNSAIPYYSEDQPDAYGYIANAAGNQFVDVGVGGFLRGPANVNADWKQYADAFDGKFQTTTLRNTDKRPRPDFVKAYMHNGYLKSLKEVVHFYNTRDSLGICKGEHDPGEKQRCWPVPEVPLNVNKTIGRLGLTGREEDQIVAFLKALTDGYQP
jgi:cytochrome c peroxidase